MGKVEDALISLRKGNFVLVYDADGREEEVDFVIPSFFVEPRHVKEMRTMGGGLICSTVLAKDAEAMGLPYLVDVMSFSSQRFPILEKLLPAHLPYDAKSAFSITVNHKEAYTGITDNDRALAISSIGKLVAAIGQGDVKNGQEEFVQRFRAPGHLHLLRSSPGLLNDRAGHTELSSALCLMAGVPPSATICEMMGDGGALPKEDAKDYARQKGYPFLDGWEIVEAWKAWSG
ncbi:MAG: 3,4-dihydroxy-2-butanone-4-phosphate synthase [Candidatus Thermoplasmatota archaeon]|nr:3,4-dihydroxy-2-butanone-4-phosphate synthase [Candidatus Thermoplasmatota archaeon]